jgi:hypothetical protein
MHTLPKTLISIEAVLAIFGLLCTAQTKPDIKQEAKTATCSNIVVTGGVATFSCTGLTPEQAKLLQDIPAMLTKILKQTQDTSAIRGLVNTEVQFHYEVRFLPADYLGKKMLVLYDYVAPENNMAKQLRAIQQVTLMRGNFRDPVISQNVDREAWHRFVQDASLNRSKAVASDIGLSVRHAIPDTSTILSPTDIDDLKHLRLRIYITSVAWWKNVSGSQGSAAECVFLGSDINPDDKMGESDTSAPTHICPSSADDF